jgi:exonuclease VII large subunit
MRNLVAGMRVPARVRARLLLQYCSCIVLCHVVDVLGASAADVNGLESSLSASKDTVMAEPDNALMLTILRELRSDFRKHQDLLSGLTASQRRIVETMERRFEHVDQQLKTASEAVDRRFERVDQQFKAAAEAVDRRFTNMEHQMRDLVPDLELMLKGEMMGRLTNFEMRIDERIAELETRK